MEINDDQNSKEEKCCVITCDIPLGELFWNNQYDAKTTGWDLGEVSPPLKAYIDQLANKNLRILIPGCGNTYEAGYLLQQGFTDITVIDIAPTLVAQLKDKFASNPHIKIILGDFFEHIGAYDLILEQTFFCAINPPLRKDYVTKMNELLAPDGKLVGVLFDKEFEQPGPPFGGCKCQYEPMFEKDFTFKTFELCNNSFVKRHGTELFINLQKNPG
jgi:SAM-dependent methyltransferase